MNSTRRETVLNLIGLGLLTFCFLLSLGHIFGRFVRQKSVTTQTTIRFSHWQLESGLRTAYDHLAAEYMKIHPDIRVEQMPVPEQIYPNWLRTQLIGGTAPEIIEIGGKGETDEILANYFEPLARYLEQPNPYNQGNELAKVPWRETFVDGLRSVYNQGLLQYYSVPNSLFTVRMFYNRPLWRKIFGSEVQPRTYEELIEVCRRTAAYRTSAGQSILPLAGSQNNAPFLIQRLFSSQTQRLFYSLARPGELYPDDEQLALGFLAGKWSLDTPAVRDGLELASGVGQFLPPGFLQLRREDALFLFSQGRALMTVTGSWDAPSLRSQATFEVGVFDVPVPATDDPRYGRNTVGTVSEAGSGTGLTFAMTKQDSAAKEALVMDFLHFMTSRATNQRFSDDSGWLPAVIGVQPLPAVQPFLPRTEGYPAGFSMGINKGDGGGSFGAETALVEETNMYLLFQGKDGPQSYVQAVSGPIRTALIRDFNNNQLGQVEAIVRQETTLAAFRALARNAARTGSNHDAATDWADKADELGELQTQEEIAVAIRRRSLKQIGVALDK